MDLLFEVAAVFAVVATLLLVKMVYTEISERMQDKRQSGTR